MSKLNAGAFAFVPGRAFGTPQSSQQPAGALQLPQPIERPPQDEAPVPPPTITLNIGSSKPTPPIVPATVPSKAAASGQEPPAIKNTTPSINNTPPASTTTTSKTFTMERAKTDANAVTQDVHTLADHETLKDLYGDCKSTI